MPTDTLTSQGARPRPEREDYSPAGNITRSLLGYLALAGPFYVVVSLAQALTRRGFNLARDEWSLLAVGHLGWIQQANLVLAAAVIVSSAWLTAVAVDLYRRTRAADARAADARAADARAANAPAGDVR